MNTQEKDLSDLTPQLIDLEGWRVEVVTHYGECRRFYVGRSCGRRPVHLEVHNRRSLGGSPAEKSYRSVTRLYRR